MTYTHRNVIFLLCLTALRVFGWMQNATGQKSGFGGKLEERWLGISGSLCFIGCLKVDFCAVFFQKYINWTRIKNKYFEKLKTCIVEWLKSTLNFKLSHLFMNILNFIFRKIKYASLLDFQIRNLRSWYFLCFIFSLKHFRGQFANNLTSPFLFVLLTCKNV